MEELREKALAYLTRREHSRFELKLKLRNAAEPDEIDQLLDELATKGLQSNARYTEVLVRTRVQAGFGPVRIRQELKQHAIDASLIQQHLPEDQDYWQPHLHKVWQKKYHSNKSSDRKDTARQMRFLLQRGFDQRMVIKLLKNISE